MDALMSAYGRGGHRKASTRTAGAAAAAAAAVVDSYEQIPTSANY